MPVDEEATVVPVLCVRLCLEDVQFAWASSRVKPVALNDVCLLVVCVCRRRLLTYRHVLVIIVPVTRQYSQSISTAFRLRDVFYMYVCLIRLDIFWYFMFHR